jgi:hypothetical protein
MNKISEILKLSSISSDEIMHQKFLKVHRVLASLLDIDQVIANKN